jgi:hypothetical protein
MGFSRFSFGRKPDKWGILEMAASPHRRGEKSATDPGLPVFTPFAVSFRTAKTIKVKRCFHAPWVRHRRMGGCVPSADPASLPVSVSGSRSAHYKKALFDPKNLRAFHL